MKTEKETKYLFNYTNKTPAHSLPTVLGTSCNERHLCHHDSMHPAEKYRCT